MFVQWQWTHTCLLESLFLSAFIIFFFFLNEIKLWFISFKYQLWPHFVKIVQWIEVIIAENMNFVFLCRSVPFKEDLILYSVFKGAMYRSHDDNHKLWFTIKFLLSWFDFARTISLASISSLWMFVNTIDLEMLSNHTQDRIVAFEACFGWMRYVYGCRFFCFINWTKIFEWKHCTKWSVNYGQQWLCIKLRSRKIKIDSALEITTHFFFHKSTEIYLTKIKNINIFLTKNSLD